MLLLQDWQNWYICAYQVMEIWAGQVVFKAWSRLGWLTDLDYSASDYNAGCNWRHYVPALFKWMWCWVPGVSALSWATRWGWSAGACMPFLGASGCVQDLSLRARLLYPLQTRLVGCDLYFARSLLERLCPSGSYHAGFKCEWLDIIDHRYGNFQSDNWVSRDHCP